MDVGLTLPGGGALATAEGLGAVAQAAERRGFTSVWAADHLAIPAEVRSRYPYSPDGVFRWTPERPWLDPFLTLGLVAARTQTIRLGISVLVLPLRHPLVVAKSAATLDYLSGGRLFLGVGAGWLAEEFALAGQPFGDRYGRAEEEIAILRACWGPNPVSFTGRHYRLADFAMSPKPAQGDQVPILVGGHGRRSLELTARAGSGWHPLNLPPAGYEAGLRRLDALLAESGRSLSDLLLTFVLDSGQVRTRDALDDYDALGARLGVLDIDYSSGSLADAEREMDRLGALLAL